LEEINNHANEGNALDSFKYAWMEMREFFWACGFLYMNIGTKLGVFKNNE
jgi:hypothetical protein